MSMKIFVAWRVPLKRFPEATSELHDILSQAFYDEYVKRKYNLMLKRFISNGNVIKSTNDLYDFVRSAEDKLHKAFKENFFTSYGFNFYLDSRFAYIIPYGHWNITVPDWIEDYHYQNQVDEDHGLSTKQWKARYKKWIELDPDNPKTKYTHRVVDLSQGFYTTFSLFTAKWVQSKTEELKLK